GHARVPRRGGRPESPDGGRRNAVPEERAGRSACGQGGIDGARLGMGLQHQAGDAEAQLEHGLMKHFLEGISAAGVLHGWMLAAAGFVLGCAPAGPDSAARNTPASEEVSVPIEVPVMSAEDAATVLAETKGSVAAVNFWATWC